MLIINILQNFQAKTQAIICGNFVEIQSQIRVKLSKTKNGEYIPVRPGKHCIAPDRSSKCHNRNHPDHC